MDRSTKSFFAVNLLVVALLLIVNLVINPEALGSWGTIATVLTLGGSILLWVWLWLDSRPAVEAPVAVGDLQLPQNQIQEWAVPAPLSVGAAPSTPLPFLEDTAPVGIDVLEPEIVPANITVTDEVQAIPADVLVTDEVRAVALDTAPDRLEPEIMMADVLVTDEVQAIPADVLVTDEVPRVVLPAEAEDAASAPAVAAQVDHTPKVIEPADPPITGEVSPARLEPDVVPATVTPTDQQPATVRPIVASQVAPLPEPGNMETAVSGAIDAAENPRIEPAEVPALHEVPVIPEVPAEDFPAVAAAVPSATGEIDNLTEIEGIGPKYNQTLHNAGVNTFAQLAAASAEQLTQILQGGGYTRIPASISTWAEQAGYLVRGDRGGLKQFQDALVGGRRPGTGDD